MVVKRGHILIPPPPHPGRWRCSLWSSRSKLALPCLTRLAISPCTATIPKVGVWRLVKNTPPPCSQPPPLADPDSEGGRLLMHKADAFLSTHIASMYRFRGRPVISRPGAIPSPSNRHCIVCGWHGSRLQMSIPSGDQNSLMTLLNFPFYPCAGTLEGSLMVLVPLEEVRWIWTRTPPCS